MIVLAIILAITAVLAWGIRRGRKTDLRNDANTMRAALKAAFDRSAATGASHRVVLDLDGQVYRVERCEGKVLLRRSVDEAKAQEAAQLEAQKRALLAEEAQQQAKNQAQLAPGLEAPPIIPTADLPTCGPAQGRVGRPIKPTRSRGVKISKVWVAHLEEPVTEGQAVIHFFPPGWAERAVVELSDGESTYTLIVEPLTGRVRMDNEPMRDADDYIREDAEGEEVFEE